MNEQTLIGNGYKEFPKSPFCPKYASKAFQKRILNAFGDTLYFINIYKYDAVPEHNCPESYSATVQFTYRNRKMDEFIDVTVSGVTSIKRLEIQIHHMWRCSGADMYEKRGEYEEG